MHLRRTARRAAAGVRWLAPALLLAVALGATEARAYGIATHAWLAEEAATRLAQSDPALAFLVTDPHARACYIYGAFFPDTRSIARQAPSLQRLKSTLEGVPLIAGVKFDTTDVQTSFQAFNTHDSRLALLLIDRARQTGDRYKLAFALGTLTHILQDKHAQVMTVPTLTQSCPCGDVGVDGFDDPARAAAHYPGDQNELVIEGFGDQLRPAATLAFLRDAPWRLAANETVSYARAMELRRFYYQTVVLFTQSVGRPTPPEHGVLNGAKLFETSCSLYPAFTGHEPPADALRLFLLRYVELEWWAQIANGAATLIAQNLTGATDLFELLAPFIPLGALGGQVGGTSPVTEVLFAYAHGPAEVQRVRAKYASNLELDRLAASGLLDPAFYARADYETSHVLVVDGCTRLGASLYTDDARWPTYSRKAMRAAAIRSLTEIGTPAGAANAPGVHLFDLRYQDAATAQGFGAELRLPADVGRTLRVELELYGVYQDPEPRLIRLRLRGDVTSSPADPILAEAAVAVPAAALDPRTYRTSPRPVLALDWTVADVAGARGVYVEMDEVRVGLAAAGGAADRLLSTEITPLQAAMAGRPHYQLHYASSYAGELSSLRIRR